MSSTVIVNSSHIIDPINNSVFTYKFPTQVRVADKQIALSSVSLYYSWPNVTNVNNSLSYTWVNGTVYNITIPDGFYEASDILAYLQFEMRKNGHYLVSDDDKFVYYIDLVVNPTAYTIDIITYPVPQTLPSGWTNPASFTFSTTANKHPRLKLISCNELLGYPANYETVDVSNVDTVIYQSPLAPNMNPNSSITLICDQAKNEFSNVGIMYAIAPSVKIGSLYVDKPASPIFLPLKNGNYSELTFRLTNSLTGLPVSIKDPQVVLLFVIK